MTEARQSAESVRPQVFLKVCHYCGAELRAFDYTSRFTAWGWHLRTAHFKTWGTK